MLTSCSSDDDSNNASGTLLTKIIETYADGSVETLTIEYDVNKITRYSWDSNLRDETLFTYTGDLITKEEYFFDDGEGYSFEEVIDYEYDSSGRLIRSTRTNVGSFETDVTVDDFTYNNNGTVSFTTTVNSNGLTIEKSGNHLFLRATSAPSGEHWNFDVDSNNKLSVINDNSVGVSINDGDTSWSVGSDESIKENIVELSGVLDKVDSYRCVEYNLIGNDKKKIGFIAQDWEKDFSPIVDSDKDGILSMKYTETIPVLLKAIQELKAEIELLKSQING
jgi:hypothetical protein